MMQQKNKNTKRAKPDESDAAKAPAKEPKASEAESPASKSSPSPPSSADVTPSWQGSRILLIALAVIAVAAIGYRFMVPPQGEQAQSAAPPPPTVTVAKPLVQNLKEWREFTGQFEAEESVEIRARVSGYLESRNFTDGQLVKKGDLLFVIEPRPFEIALNSAKAQVSQAQAELELAQVQLERTVKLLKSEYASEETHDERIAEVQGAIASRDNALAAVDQAQLNIDYTRVTAPVSGRVGRHEVSVGNLVMGGIGGSTTLLTTIVSINPISLMFNVSEGDGMTYKRLIAKGEIPSARSNNVQVEGQLMDESDWPLKGAIDFVDNQYDRSSGTIRVRASFPNPNLFITPGQFGRVRVPMSQEKPTMLVPDAAIVTDQSVKLLYTVTADGTVVSKPVELGSVTDEGLRIIRSGVTPDDEIIINGLLRARPGKKVTPEQGTVAAPNAAPASQR